MVIHDRQIDGRVALIQVIVCIYIVRWTYFACEHLEDGEEGDAKVGEAAARPSLGRKRNERLFSHKE